jgi:hypothetical protein
MQTLLKEFFDTKPILPKTSQTHFPRINGFRPSALQSTITKLHDDRWRLAKSKLSLRDEEKQSEDHLVDVAVPPRGSVISMNGSFTGLVPMPPPASPVPSNGKGALKPEGGEVKAESEYYYRAVADSMFSDSFLLPSNCLFIMTTHLTLFCL